MLCSNRFSKCLAARVAARATSRAASSPIPLRAKKRWRSRGNGCPAKSRELQVAHEVADKIEAVTMEAFKIARTFGKRVEEVIVCDDTERRDQSARSTICSQRKFAPLSPGTRIQRLILSRAVNGSRALLLLSCGSSGITCGS